MKVLSILVSSILWHVVSCTNETDKKAAFDQVLHIHRRWYAEAVQGLFGSIQKKLATQLPFWYGQQLKTCYKYAKNEIKSQAKCLSNAFDKKRHVVNNHSTKWIGGFAVRKEANSRTKWPGFNRRTLRTNAPEETTHPTIIPKRIRGRSRLAYFNSRSAVLNAKLRHESSRGRFRSKRQITHVKYYDKMPHLMGKKTPSFGYSIISTLFGDILKRNSTNNLSWNEKHQKLKRYMDLAKRVNTNRRRYKNLFSHRDFAQPKSEVESFVDSLLSYVSSIPEGKMSASIFSPKFFSVTEDQSNFRFLSPDLFSFLNNSKTILSLPQLLSSFGQNERDAWLELIMKASGADEQVDKILKFFQDPTSRSDEERIFKADLRQLHYWDKVWEKSDKYQAKRLKDDGYALMNSEQMNLLYGSNGLYDSSEIELDIDLVKYGRMSEKDKEEALENVIHSMASGKDLRAGMKSWNRRLQQSVLQPAAFSPSILAPSVLGPAILSPSIFSPAILSPAALNPSILSPGVGNAAILSPDVLSPVIVSAFVLSPGVLSPYALSPHILRPTVLGPTILSPYVLSPDILGPSVLGGNILSPHALSPVILNPGVLDANVLSPGILSK